MSWNKKNSMGDRWRRLGHKKSFKNFILTWNHGFTHKFHVHQLASDAVWRMEPVVKINRERYWDILQLNKTKHVADNKFVFK